MKVDHQRMVVFVKPQQPGPQRRFPFNVERLPQQFECLPSNRCRSLVLGTCSEANALEIWPSRSHCLYRLAKMFDESRSQHLVAPADGRDARIQRIRIERAEQ